MNGPDYAVAVVAGFFLLWAVWWFLCVVALMVADRTPIVFDADGRAVASRMQPVTVSACGHRWPFMPEIDDPHVTHHQCGLRDRHRGAHRCRDCDAIRERNMP